MKRADDPNETTRFRSDRYFVVDKKWYFTTREGTNEGPFDSAEAARQGLARYLMDRGLSPSRNEPWDALGASN